MAKKPTNPPDGNKPEPPPKPPGSPLDQYVDKAPIEDQPVEVEHTLVRRLEEQIKGLEIQVEMLNRQLGNQKVMSTEERSQKIQDIEDRLQKEAEFHGQKRFFITVPRIRTKVVKGKNVEYNWSHIRVELFGKDKESVTDRFNRKTRFTGSGESPYVVQSEAEHREFYGSSF